MGWLTFASEIFKAVVWPVTIIIAVYVLRGPFQMLLQELKRLKWKDVEVEFERGVREVKDKLESQSTRYEVAIYGNLESSFMSLAETSPKAAVLSTWVLIEQETLKLFNRNDIELPQKITSVQMANILRQRELLDEHSLWLFDSLRQLRNRAAHENEVEITEEGGLAYMSMAMDLIQYLREKK